METNKIKSPGLREIKSFDKTEYKTLTPQEQESIAFYIERAKKARDQREQHWEYFDGMTFSQDYISNRRAKNTYLRPKKNDSEVRIVGGTTEKKIEVIANELLRINFQPEIRAFDEYDNELKEFGEDITDLVNRTNEIEKDDDVWQEFIGEILSQRAAFLQEEIDYKIISNSEKKSRTIKLPYFRKRLISGLKVFLGDIKIPPYRFNEQPYICIYGRTNYKEAKKMFENFDNFKYVKPRRDYEADELNTWKIAELDSDEVEFIYYLSVPDNECQIIVNGELMYEIGHKMERDYGEYGLVMSVLKSMDIEFAYGKPLTASAKVMQALSDESLRMMITKFQQALKPAFGVVEAKAKIFSRDIWAPGTIVQGVTANDFTRLTDHQGVTGSEQGFWQIIEEKTKEFIGAGDNQQGLQQKSNTATEAQIQQMQFIKQLGYSVLAVMRAKRDATYLRINSILQEFTKPYKEEVNPLTQEIQKVFKGFTINNVDLGYGKFGRKEIQFTDQELNQDDLTSLREEEIKAEEMGEPFRRKFFNVNILKQFPFFFYVTINEKPESSSALDKAMFKEKLADAMQVSQIAGRPLKGDKIVEDFGRLNKAKDWFEDNVPMSGMMGEIAPPMNQPMTPPQSGIGQEMIPQNNRPSVNVLGNMAPSTI